MMKHVSEVFDEWLNWPGAPFPWQKCDSPIEDFMFHQFYKFASDQVALSRQHQIDTDSGRFRLDFLLTHRTTGRPIGIECDGRDFHCVARDRKRDEAIIRSGRVAKIYRIRGKDCLYCGHDVVQLLAQCEPWIVIKEFREQSTFYPHPTSYQDEQVEISEGYRGIMRSYFEEVEGEYEDRECYCERECECVPIPVMVRSHERTPTLIRYMSGRGFPSAFECPAHLKPLPMPHWKIELREAWNAASISEATPK